MKLLFDQKLSFRLCRLLSDLFPDSNQVRLVGLERAIDRDVWIYAQANEFCIVTQDSDYADMSALYGSPPKVNWLRCGNQPTSTIEQLIRRHEAEISTVANDDDTDCLELL
jgi:predicted nuclease of predicted toxin-antitoxin system